jgi:hypothetical protein
LNSKISTTPAVQDIDGERAGEEEEEEEEIVR